LVKSKIHAPHFLAFFQNSCRVAERIVVFVWEKNTDKRKKKNLILHWRVIIFQVSSNCNV